MMVNTVALAPMPSERVNTAKNVKKKFLRSERPA
jgi:hypothetical protein